MYLADYGSYPDTCQSRTPLLLERRADTTPRGPRMYELGGAAGALALVAAAHPRAERLWIRRVR